MPMETSHIWLTTFPSEERLDEYIEETYSEDEEDDDAPINEFAAGQGEGFYDHDWIERSFNRSNDLRKLIAGHSYSDTYIDKAIEAARARDITNANTFIMADIEEFSDPQTVEGDGYKLWYIGTYKCDA